MKHLILFVFIALTFNATAQWRDYNFRIDKNQNPDSTYVMLSDSDSTSSYFGRGSWTLLSSLSISTSESVLHRVKITKSYTDFDDDTTQRSIVIYSLPAKAVITQVAFNPSTGFTGGGVTDYKISIGDDDSLTKWSSAITAYTTNAAYSQTNSGSIFVDSMVSTTDVLATAKSFDGNLEDVTAGSVDIWIYYLILD